MLGGFVALSWLNAAACASTIGIALLGEARLAAVLLAMLGIPKIAYPTAPRSDLFTTVLFAALLVVLWRTFRGRPAPLWSIPVIFFIWANTHIGFVAGFVLLLGYVILEVGDFVVPERRAVARARLRSAAPWLVAAVPMTLCNSWGWGIYQGRYSARSATWSRNRTSSLSGDTCP